MGAWAEQGAAWADEGELSPAELLELLERERARAGAAIGPDPRLVYGVWGLAWLLGFGAQYAGLTGDLAPAVAGVAFLLLLVAAAVVTAVHMARRFAGVRGVSTRVGAMYGWTWTLGFVAYGAIMSSAARAGVAETVMGLLWSAGSGLVAGLLYMTSGALWQDRVQYGLGAWILLTSAAGALAGAPVIYLVMSLAGGGGFLLAAAYFAVRGNRGVT